MRTVVTDAFCAAFGLLCLAVLALWVRSYSASSSFPRSLAGSGVQAYSWYGHITLAAFRINSPNARVSVTLDPPGIGARLPPCPPRPELDPGLDANVMVLDVRTGFAAAGMRNGFGFHAPVVSDRIPISTGGSWQYALLVVPHWFVAGLLVLLPMVTTVTRLGRWFRSRKGLCVTCGYDLHGNVSGNCPECGAMAGSGR